MSTQTIELYFGENHDRLDELFRQFQMNKEIYFSKAKECFKAFKFGLERHIAVEEEILFPVFEEKTALWDTGPTVVMRSEHREIEKALEAIHKKVQKNDPGCDREETELIALLKRHSRKEKNILYPLLDELTEFEERNEIFKKIQDFPEEKHKTCCCQMKLD